MLPGQYLHSDLAKGSIVCRGAQPLSWNSSREKEIEGIGGPPKEGTTGPIRGPAQGVKLGGGAGEIYVGLSSRRKSWDQDGP